jgi:glycosyltransferase involved in cell wall biosynthesis
MVPALRIIHVLEPPDGGVPTHVRDVSRGLLARGHTVGAIVPKRGPLEKQLTELGVETTAIDLVPEIFAPGADVRAARKIGAILRSRRWDLLHTHGNKAGALGRPLGKLLGVPVVHTAHSFAYITQEHRPRWGMKARRSLTLGIERVLAPCAKVIVCASDDERRKAIRDRVAASSKFVLIHYGVDAPPPVEPDPLFTELRARAPLIGFVARLDIQKSPLHLVDALTLLRERGVDFTAALVGDGPLEDDVRKRVTEGGLDGQVVGLPFRKFGDRVLGALDIFVLTSRWEALPIGILEAMAAGLPVVASDVCGIPEEVAHGETGLLVPMDDTPALADALGRLVSDRDMRERMGRAGLARQQTEFSLDRMVDQLESLYVCVLDPKREPRSAPGR